MSALLPSPVTKQLDRKKYAKTIDESARHLLELINHIIDYAQIEAKKLTLRIEPIDVRELFETVREIVHPQAIGKGLALIVDVHPDVPLRIAGDKTRVRQILLNLISNSIKFTEQGHVSVVVSAVHQEGSTVTINIDGIDTGIGIKEQDQSRIFEPFERTAHSAERPIGGSGLGLAIVKELAALMGGDVGVRSRLGYGSIFWVRIPFVISADTPVPEHDSFERNCGRRYRIFVAEDNRTSQFVMEEFLTPIGHDTEVVDDGEEALARLQMGHSTWPSSI